MTTEITQNKRSWVLVPDRKPEIRRRRHVEVTGVLARSYLLPGSRYRWSSFLFRKSGRRSHLSQTPNIFFVHVHYCSCRHEIHVVNCGSTTVAGDSYCCSPHATAADSAGPMSTSTAVFGFRLRCGRFRMFLNKNLDF